MVISLENLKKSAQHLENELTDLLMHGNFQRSHFLNISDKNIDYLN